MHQFGQGFCDNAASPIRPGSKADEIKTRAAKWLQANQAALDAVVTEFGSWSASDLELGSTVLFVDREFSSEPGKATMESVAGMIHEIKPHFSEAVILKRVKPFYAKGWLQSIL